MSGFGAIARTILICVFTPVGYAVTIRVAIEWISECFDLLVDVADAIAVKIAGHVLRLRIHLIAVTGSRIGWRTILRLFWLSWRARRRWLLVVRNSGVILRVYRITVHKVALGKVFWPSDARKLITITFPAKVGISKQWMGANALLYKVC